MLGIVEEQHPDRTRLFMQWQHMTWPVMVDSLNLFGVAAVPRTLLVDEAGIVRAVQPDDSEFEAFLSRAKPTDPLVPDRSGSKRGDWVHLERAVAAGVEGARKQLADALFLWHRDSRELDRSIELYAAVLKGRPDDGSGHFRLGVAYKRRSELLQSAEDFRSAVNEWRRALEIDPNQYIWRRRIQQYGPRLDKPYSFYDWVHEARNEILRRGETPVPLTVEPSGAEFAHPASLSLQNGGDPGANPDPRGRIQRDTEELISVQAILVPDTSRGNRVVRVHLEFKPNTGSEAHWNNEAGDMQVWVDPPERWAVDSRRIVFEVPHRPVSRELRSIEFELHAPPDFVGLAEAAAYALYYVCEDIHGTCLYRRQDVTIELQVP